jgi:5-deoxy-glucuronate isomerase
MNSPSSGGDPTLRDTLFRVPRQNGLHAMQTRGEGGARELSSWRLRLGPQEDAVFRSPDEEAVLVLQEGNGRLEVSDNAWEVSRSSVFEEPATALYLPSGVRLTIAAHVPLEAIIVAAPAQPGGLPVLVSAHQIQVHRRGTGNYRREVHDILVHDTYAKRLLVGETFNPPGNWSSYPPHKHDGKDGEPRLEEVYHYRVDPPQGFGLQSLYTAAAESVTHMVRDGDAVCIPYGYHPVCAPPGYRLYYLWALVGEQRVLAVHEDPHHNWITTS